MLQISGLSMQGLLEHHMERGIGGGNKVGFDLEDCVPSQKTHHFLAKGKQSKTKKKIFKTVDTAGIVKLTECFSFSFYLYIHTTEARLGREREGEALPVAFEINVLFSKGNWSLPLHFFFLFFFWMLLVLCIFEKKLQRDGNWTALRCRCVIFL